MSETSALQNRPWRFKQHRAHRLLFDPYEDGRSGGKVRAGADVFEGN